MDPSKITVKQLGKKITWVMGAVVAIGAFSAAWQSLGLRVLTTDYWVKEYVREQTKDFVTRDEFEKLDDRLRDVERSRR